MTSLVSNLTLNKDANAENHNSSIFYKCGDTNNVKVTDGDIINSIKNANTAEELIEVFKNSAAHPQLTKSKLLHAAKEKKSKVTSEIWTKGVAKLFGSALKAAKISESLTDRFVEVFHPEWLRWRCAKVLSRINSIRKVENNKKTDDNSMEIDTDDDNNNNNNDSINNNNNNNNNNDVITNNANPINGLVESLSSMTTTTTSSDGASGQQQADQMGNDNVEKGEDQTNSVKQETTTKQELVESLEVQFFDGDTIYKVYANDTKELPYNSLPMLLAASEGNIARLVALIENNSTNVILIRTGCSLLISLTVGKGGSINSDVDRNQMLSETNCIEVACSLLAQRKQFVDDGDTVESVLRVLLNLACNEYNIPRMCEANGVELIIQSMEIFPQHSGVQYAASKTIHNMAIDNVEIANKSRTLGIEALINQAIKRFKDYTALKDWGESSINVIKRFATITIET